MLYAKLVPPLNVARAMIVLGLTLVPNAAQQAPPATPVRFDVISIKPVTSPRNSSPTNIDHGSMTAENISIPRLIQAAFEVHDYQILNTPGWVDGARYDVLAKCDSATYVTGRQMAPMIQNLLKDRFDFRYHRETRDRPGYRLIATKGGPKLKESQPDGGSGTNITNYNSGKVSIEARRMSLAQLAKVLEDLLQQPVVDGTGVRGDFDIKLEYDSSLNADSTLAPVFSALQEQLGLRLQSEKVPVETIIVENVHQPSEN